MKVASILVFLALLILPNWILVSYYISQILTKGAKGVESSKPSPKFVQFRSQHKILFYLLIFSYWLVLFASLCWVIYEFTVGLGKFMQLSIVGVSLFFIMMVAYMAWSLVRAEQIQKKFPRPETGTSSKEYLDWQNKIMDETFNHYSVRILFRNWGFACGVILLVAGLFVLVAYLVLR